MDEEEIGLTIAALVLIVVFAVSTYIGYLWIHGILSEHRIQTWELSLQRMLQESYNSPSAWHADRWVYRHECDI
jgi:hypothetical protein